MLAELHAIQVHLWILTVLLLVILLAAGYCNYSRINSQGAASPYELMKRLSDAEKFEELRKYATDYLKTHPNSPEALFFNTEAHMRLESFDLARSSANKLARSSPTWRKSALTFIEMIDEVQSGS